MQDLNTAKETGGRTEELQKRAYKVFRFLFVAAMAFSILFTTLRGMTSRVYAADNEGSYGISSIASTLGAILNLGLTPTDKSNEDNKVDGVMGVYPLRGTNTGNAGAVVSFIDSGFSPFSWITTVMSGSSSSYDYSTLRNIPTGSGDSESGAFYYAAYGHALGELGLDKGITKASGTVPISRMIQGGILTLAYSASLCVHSLFSVAITVLQFLNPFSWFDEVVQRRIPDYGNDGILRFYDIVEDGSTGTGFMKSIKNFAANIYIWIGNLSWSVTIPLMIGFYLAGVFLFKKTAGTRRLVIRIIFLAVGIPAAGFVYTAFLKDMKEVAGSSTDVDNVVMSTMVDFESWAKYTHLAPPKDSLSITFVANEEEGSGTGFKTSGTVTGNTLLNLRSTCLSINKLAISAKEAGQSAELDTLKNVDENTSTDEKQYAPAGTASALPTDEDGMKARTGDTIATSAYVYDMISRYASADVYTGESFASYIQRAISAEPGGARDKLITGITSSEYRKFMEAASNAKSYVEFGAVHDSFLDNAAKRWSTGAQLYPKETANFIIESEKYDVSGNLAAKVGNAQKEVSASDGSYTFENLCRPNYTIKGYRTIINDGMLVGTRGIKTGKKDNSKVITYGLGTNDYRGSLNEFGLSTVAMYNYLNSDFGNDSITVYGGSTGITSALTLKRHCSVNIIGNGLLSVLYWLDTVTLLGAISLIGMFYAFGIMSHSIKNCISIITTVPMAMTGSIRYIAKFIGIIVTMILNVLITIILYTIAVAFLVTVAQTVENAVGNVLGATDGILSLGATAATQGVNVAVAMSVLSVINLVSIIIIFIVTVKLIKVRKSIIAEITEYVQQIVSKFLGADSHGDPQKPKHNLGQQLLSGAAAGASMAAGNSLARSVSSHVKGALASAAGGNGGGDGGGSDGTGSASTGGIEREGSGQTASAKPESGYDVAGITKTVADRGNSQNSTPENEESKGVQAQNDTGNPAQSPENKGADTAEQNGQTRDAQGMQGQTPQLSARELHAQADKLGAKATQMEEAAKEHSKKAAEDSARALATGDVAAAAKAANEIKSAAEETKAAKEMREQATQTRVAATAAEEQERKAAEDSKQLATSTASERRTLNNSTGGINGNNGMNGETGTSAEPKPAGPDIMHNTQSVTNTPTEGIPKEPADENSASVTSISNSQENLSPTDSVQPAEMEDISSRQAAGFEPVMEPGKQPEESGRPHDAVQNEIRPEEKKQPETKTPEVKPPEKPKGLVENQKGGTGQNKPSPGMAPQNLAKAKQTANTANKLGKTPAAPAAKRALKTVVKAGVTPKGVAITAAGVAAAKKLSDKKKENDNKNKK